MKKDKLTRDEVREYYGTVLKGTADLQTSACCPAGSMPARHREILKEIAPEVIEKFYGCGSPIPPLLEGCAVLDLGCGTGRDAYIVSRLVGPGGYVIGVDMTDVQLEVALRYLPGQMERFGYATPNVDFRKGYIEDLKACGIEDGSIDVVISNCVINLSPDKRAVFSEIFRVLKPGGELYFSDVFSGRRVPDDVRNDPVLYGECLGGALYLEDFRRILRDLGCPDYRVVSRTKIAIENPELRQKTGEIDFYSMTIRAFRLDDCEDRCEDYGQSAAYRGTIEEAPDKFVLDDGHFFMTGEPLRVCGNTASMVEGTRYAPHFIVDGNRSVHYGLFDCAPPADAGEPCCTPSPAREGSCCAPAGPAEDKLPAGCMVCGVPLTYRETSVTEACHYCGKEFRVNAVCENGHFVCDACHSCDALEVIKGICLEAADGDMIGLLKRIRSHARIPLHGPEHHSLVPGVILSVYRNRGGEISDAAILEGIERGSTIAGGACGYLGVCGAPAGVGIAFSIILGADPLTGKRRQTVLSITGEVLRRVSRYEAARCCQRECWTALKAAAELSGTYLPVALPAEETLVCGQYAMNEECIGVKCPLFPGARVRE